jgi:hypothetical protein
LVYYYSNLFFPFWSSFPEMKQKLHKKNARATYNFGHMTYFTHFGLWLLLKTIGSEERLLIQKPKDHTSMWTMLGEWAPTLLQPCSLFPSLYHHIDKPYGITISLPPYSNMFVVLTYLKSTYVFDYLQHLSTTLFIVYDHGFEGRSWKWTNNVLTIFHLILVFFVFCLQMPQMHVSLSWCSQNFLVGA